MRTAERLGWWDRLWFDQQHSATLTFLRWVVFSSIAVNAWVGRAASRRFPDRAEVLWDPISLLAAVRFPQPAPWVIELLIASVLVGAALTLLRIWPRWTGLAAALGYFHLVLMENSFGKISHGKQPLVVMALILAIAPIPARHAPPSWRWHWPVQLCRTVLGVTLAAAAFSKLQRSGLEWVLSENMRNILVMESLVLRDPALPGLAGWIASEPWRWQAAAAGAVAGEASLIGAVWVTSPRLRSLLVVAGAATVSGITLLMDLIGFPIVLLCAIFASPHTALDLIAAGRSRLLAVAVPLAGMAALAGVLLVHAGKPTFHALPLLVGAVVLVALTWRGPDVPLHGVPVSPRPRETPVPVAVAGAGSWPARASAQAWSTAMMRLASVTRSGASRSGGAKAGA